MRSTILLTGITAAFTLTAAACRGASGGQRDADAPGNAAVSATSAGAAASNVPASIEAIGHHGENAYDMAKLREWAKARASADSLRPALAAIPAAATTDKASPLDVAIAFRKLDRAIASQDRLAALRASNRLTQLGALLSASYQPQVPPDVTLLDYYGRELEIWTAVGNRVKLHETASAMRRTWDALRPLLETRGGHGEAVRFEALVAQAETAVTPAEYGRIATPVLDAVDRLEQVFTRPTQ
jgi:hypothetical protein